MGRYLRHEHVRVEDSPDHAAINCFFALFYLSPYQAEPGREGLLDGYGWMWIGTWMDVHVDAVKVVDEARLDLLTYLDSRGDSLELSSMFNVQCSMLAGWIARPEYCFVRTLQRPIASYSGRDRKGRLNAG
jgi:hypothetical protein